MKPTDSTPQTAQQAAGLVVSAAAGTIWAAVVRRCDGGFERIYQGRFELADGLDSAVDQVLKQAGHGQTSVVIGLDSAQLRYLDLELPPADADQLPMLIRTQAEARLPLDSDRMQLAWHIAPTAQGYACTVAAARLDTTSAALGKLSVSSHVAAIVPDASGLACLRPRLFAPTPERCLIVRRRSEGIALVLAEGTTALRSTTVGADASDVAERPELVIQDIRIELEALRHDRQEDIPIYLWPGDDAFMQHLAEQLAQTGRQVSSLETDPDALTQAGLTDHDTLASAALEATGLAVLGLFETAPAFDFLQSQQATQSVEDTVRQRKKRLRAAAAVVILAILCAAVSYAGLQLEVRQLRRELAVEVDGLNAATVLEQQAYQEAVARARPDLLELLEAIQDARDGMLLDSIEFEQARPVRLVATAGSYEQIYAFQRRLQAHDGIREVRLLDPRMDEQNRRVRFTLQFHYRHFTQ